MNRTITIEQIKDLNPDNDLLKDVSDKAITELSTVIDNEGNLEFFDNPISITVKELLQLSIHQSWIFENLLTLEDEQTVLESKDPKCCCLFAYHVSGANIEALQQIVLESKNTECCYWFARFIKGANVEKLKQVYITEEAQDIKIA